MRRGDTSNLSQSSYHLAWPQYALLCVDIFRCRKKGEHARKRARANTHVDYISRRGIRDESWCHNDFLSEQNTIAINQRAGYTTPRGARDSLAFFRATAVGKRDARR